MDIDKKIKELNAKGIMLNNLFQDSPNGFRANFRHVDKWSFNYGQGSTPSEAILDAEKHVYDTDYAAAKKREAGHKHRVVDEALPTKKPKGRVRL